MSLPGLIPKTTLPFAPEEFLQRVAKGAIKLPDVAPLIPPREIMNLYNGKINPTGGKLPGISYVDKLPSLNKPYYPITSEVVPNYPIKTSSEDVPDNNLLYILLGITLLGYFAN